MPKDTAGRLDRIQEECAEVTVAAGRVIVAVSKLKRFGDRRWPDAAAESNAEALDRMMAELEFEMRDVLEAFSLARADLVAAGSLAPAQTEVAAAAE